MSTAPQEQKPSRQGKRRHRLRRWPVAVIVALLFLPLLLVAALYVPGVLNRVVSKILPKIEESSGLHIEAGNIALQWPMRLSVDRALVTDLRAGGDTLVSAQHLTARLNPAALFRGRIDIPDAELRNAFYQMGGRDSLYLSARVDSVGAAAWLNFDISEINVDHADLNGAEVCLLLGADTTATPPDTTVSSPLRIICGPVSMRNVDYRMSMATTNDTVAASLRRAFLSGGKLRVGNPIDITTGTLTVALDSALYGRRGAVPMAGFDPDWITADSCEARVDSFAMHGASLSVPLTSLRIAGLAGLTLSGNGLFAMNDSTMRADGFDISLGQSRLTVSAEMGFDSIADRAPLNVDATAGIYPRDVVAALPAYAPLLTPLPADRPLLLRVLASGTLAKLSLDSLQASMHGVFALEGRATAANLANPSQLRAVADLSGRLANSAPFASMIPHGVKLPPLSLNAHADLNGRDYSAKLTARTGGGRLALNGRLAGKAPAYDVKFRLDSFPVAAFLPEMPVGAVSGLFEARGRKFNPLLPGAELQADANVDALQLRNRRLEGIALHASLLDGNLKADLDSRIPEANLRAEINATLSPKSVGWGLRTTVHRLDLNALGLTDSIMSGRFDLTSDGFSTLALDSLSARATLNNAAIVVGNSSLAVDSLNLRAEAGRGHTSLALADRTLCADMMAAAGVDSLLKSLGEVSVMVSRMIDRRHFAADSLNRALPPLLLTLEANEDNLIGQYLKSRQIGFQSLTLRAANDSILSAKGTLLGLKSGASFAVDTITADLRSHGPALLLDIDMGNRPGTFDEFAQVCLRGSVSGNEANFFLRQSNIHGQIGYLAGAQISVADSLITMSLTPTAPVIAYKHWQVNPDNFVAFNPHTFNISANLDARGDGSRLQLLTTLRSAEADSVGSSNALTLKVSNIHIQDWLKINPFAPPVAGDFSADMRLNYNSKSVNGLGTASLDNLTYGRMLVGNFNLDMNVATDFGGAVRGDAALKINGQPAMSIFGALNDTTHRQSPLKMQLQLTDFPLSVANPFVSPDYASLSGSLNGNMDVGGTFNAMSLNGTLHFRHAKIKVGMMGSTFTLDSVNIPVDSNVVRFNDFAIYGSNSNPLRVTGNVDLRRFGNPRLNLGFHAANMQFVNSKKARGVDLYGRGYVNLDATLKGSMQFMRVDANLAILPQTNLTYHVSDAKAVAGLQPDSKMVRFVNLSDTAATMRADSVVERGMLMMLTALVDIRQGSTLTVDLSADGKNRAQIRGEGVLDYTLSPTQPDGRLTGRFTINSGFFRYSLPVISEKLFTFNPGSYVAFNGPILNPTLSIGATDRVRANVTRRGENSRLVDFDVSLGATGTLERMDVAFDLSTKDDITVQNELQSMSQTQRANQAMNLLLYGVYTGQGTTGNANLSGNALYGFLTSQLNTWAANTIKGVDISFGMDQYDRTRNGSTSTATQYSYQVSKTLFNDRFKIVVGGNYSTDAEAQENIAENLISDVSFEYMLNNSGSMYIRLFRHTGYESILEGEVTQTGVGFVVKRKIRRLADIFNFIKAAKQ